MVNFTLAKKQPPRRSQLKKNLYQLMIARSDIGAAGQACKLFRESVKSMGDDLYYPLFAAIVICYARPFTRNEPFGPLPEKWNKFADAKLQEVHDKLISARHELIAHSDMSVRKAMIVPAGVVTGIWQGKELRSSRIGTQTSFYLYPIGFFDRVWDVSVDLGRRVSGAVDQLVVELYGGMELPTRAFPIRIDDGL